MDKNAIKKYAIWARRELIARVSQKAEQYGITEQNIIDEHAEKIQGVVLTPAQVRQRQTLIQLIRRDGYQQAMEEVAYTWFNRFIALRFMEVNDYLPGHTCVFTDDQNAFKPKILSDALHLELPGMSMDKVIELKEANKTEELYQYLLITLCNYLNTILPGMFQRIDDYTELLFPEHLLREGSVLDQLVAMIPREDWLDAVQIIGWLYQYYNAEPKDLVFANLKKNIKISKENIPAATQLFTPDWIVRYMVENSLGRLWVEGHPNDSLKSGWKYYLEEAEQEPDVQAQLKTIREQYAQMKPEEIRCIDPCMGSGHILVYLFDVLVQIYEAYGYPTREAVASIVQNNLWGLDIDDRATQLAYFAVMMKARQYDKGWFRRGIEPHALALQDSSEIKEEILARFGDQKDAAFRVVEAFMNAKEYGSIIHPNVSLEELDALQEVLIHQDEMSAIGNLATQAIVDEMISIMYPLLQLARTLVQKYHVVVTNPPYMGASGMGEVLSRFIKENYPNTKSDLSTVFMECCLNLCDNSGLMAMINIPVWMFLSSYETLRKIILENNTYVNMVHPGRGIFGSDFGTTSFVIARHHIPNYIGHYRKLFDKQGEVESIDDREKAFFSGKGDFLAKQDCFSKIPGAPVAYWGGQKIIDIFEKGIPIGKLCEVKIGMGTGKNDIFVREWWEVNYSDIDFSLTNSRMLCEIQGRYVPYNKGGDYRLWYGNTSEVLWFNDEGRKAMKQMPGHRENGGFDYYFKQGITWTFVSTSNFGVRSIPTGFAFDVAGSTLFVDEELYKYVLAFLSSSTCNYILNMLNPTLNYQAGNIKSLPLIIGSKEEVSELSDQCVYVSRNDWDSYETSWDFSVHPIVRWSRDLRDATSIGATMNFFYGCYPEVHSTVELCYMLWQGECNDRFKKLKANEEELNRIFIETYGLQDELTPEVADKDVTVRKADLGRDIRSLVSYAVGCMLGRYSLDKNGLTYAGGEWHASQYATYPADVDGVLPITDDEYFSDDIVTMFVDWTKSVFGADDLEDNLKYIATALYPNGGGTARELIRQYFLNDYYKDHLKAYQKRPIYWLFDAGKKNSFKCLIYMHRYRPDTIARVRTDYVHEMQARFRTAMDELTQRVDTAMGSERVRLQKQLVKIQGQEEELRKYEEKIHHYADMMLPLDLDDGVKVNYAKLADVLAPIK